MKFTTSPHRLGVQIVALALILGSGNTFTKEQWKFQINVNAGDDEYRIAQQWAKSVADKTLGDGH